MARLLAGLLTLPGNSWLSLSAGLLTHAVVE